MGLFRLLILLAIIWAVYALVRRFRDNRDHRIAPRRSKPEIGQMVRCRQCGLHVPEQEAFRRGEDWFCSAEHRDQADG
ncbi:PP0621 family protein [Thiohalomonas denitrificans]|uniref:PP0621 family protein n=1 Tax=Thiohalomonas denitrificans TaxID=415747 RepID=UPI0026F25100|nr:PP0621 family protein [Thiohalomonas denitrificans]